MYLQADGHYSRPSTGMSRPASSASSRPGTGNKTKQSNNSRSLNNDSGGVKPVMVPIDYTHPQNTTELSLKYHNLIPATAYKFYIKAYSVSGWNAYCRPLIYHTLSSYPEQPPPLEVIKITTNGLLLTWHAPLRNNGHEIEHYQIELIDAQEQQAQSQAHAHSTNANTYSFKPNITVNTDPISTTHSEKTPRTRRANTPKSDVDISQLTLIEIMAAEAKQGINESALICLNC